MKIRIGNKTFEVSKEALESNPEEITLEFDGTLRTQEEDLTYVENQKKDARKEGIEIAVKQYRDEFGFKGRSLDKLIEAVKSKTLEDAKIEPAEQLKKIQQTLSEKETALQNALTKVDEKESEFAKYKNQSKLDAKLSKSLPKNLAYTSEDMLLIIKNKKQYDFDENGNPVVLDEMGNIKKNATTANPVSIEEDLKDFFKSNQNYLKPIEGGSGEGDSGRGGSKKTIDKFIEEQREKGNAPNSEEFNKELAIQTKAGLLEVD